MKNISIIDKFILSIKFFNLFIASPNFIESYYCYTDIFNNTKYIPWLWQFIEQKDGLSPVTHEWIIYQK